MTVDIAAIGGMLSTHEPALHAARVAGMPRQSGAGRSTRNCRFVNRVVITYLGREIAEIQPSTVVSEHPMFAIPFRGGVKPEGSAEVPVGSAEVPVGSAEVKVT